MTTVLAVDLGGTKTAIARVDRHGGMTMPWLAGHLAASAGLRAVFVLAALNFVAAALLHALAGRERRGRIQSSNGTGRTITYYGP